MISLTRALMLKGGGVVSFVGAGGKTSLMFSLAKILSAGGGCVLTTTTTKIHMPEKDQSDRVIITRNISKVLKAAEKIRSGSAHFTAAGNKLDTTPLKLNGFEPDFIDALWNGGEFRYILVEADGAAGKPLKVPAAHEPVIPESSKWVVGVAGLNGVGTPLDETHVFRPDRFAEITGAQYGKPVSEASVARSILDPRGIMKGCPSRAVKIAFLNRMDTNTRIRSGQKIAAILKKENNRFLNRVVMGNAQESRPVVAYHDL